MSWSFGLGVHWMKALPCIPSGHLQIGMWLRTSQMAVRAQVPGQGSVHLLRMQARSRGQSVWRTHSGRQPEYGSPWYSGMHEHWPFRHTAFGPQGDGLQGSSWTTAISV